MLAVVALLLLYVTYSFAQTSTIKKDSIIDGQYNIYDKRGTKEGYWEKDPLFENRYDFMDE